MRLRGGEGHRWRPRAEFIRAVRVFRWGVEVGWTGGSSGMEWVGSVRVELPYV